MAGVQTAGIIGAGVAGLSTAIALAQRGWAVCVYEQAQALGDVGAGLQISPNGTRVLAALGVWDALWPTMFEPNSIIMRMGQSGRRICDIPLAGQARARWGAPYVHIHRQDLVDGLKARLDQLCPNAVQFGAAVSVDDLMPQGFALIIAADGVHSPTRSNLFGGTAAEFTGNIAWRALVPAADVPQDLRPPKSATIWAGARRHAVTTYVRGGDMINFVGIVERGSWHSESWTGVGDKAQAMQDYAGWHPTITTLLDRADMTHQWALLRRAPLTSWAQGNVVLIGDAAHPMLPSLAQGAVQSLEDAWTLATMATGVGPGDIPATLQAFFERCIKRVSKVQRLSAANARMFHQPTPTRRAMTYGPIWAVGKLAPWVLQQRQDWLFGYDVTG